MSDPKLHSVVPPNAADADDWTPAQWAHWLEAALDGEASPSGKLPTPDARLLGVAALLQAPVSYASRWNHFVAAFRVLDRRVLAAHTEYAWSVVEELLLHLTATIEASERNRGALDTWENQLLTLRRMEAAPPDVGRMALKVLAALDRPVDDHFWEQTAATGEAPLLALEVLARRASFRTPELLARIAADPGVTDTAAA